jgi:glycosyltransferase involved in cell wall biosynthesis
MEPFLTVVVPVRNSRDSLALTLAALRRSDFTNYELIIVDDASSDGSAEVAAAYAPTHLIRMRCA